ncbi:hypothetical protein Q2T41_10415 [Maribacter confluentis]|uniref:DUF5723 domain-containing protein n=1 Tax=Maribacter confluentis TaxID=1656093 RepID=A0ABT8RQA4_9FLAO|nr:hypothetical protein [Maribacter confluentis]MDO1513069.1 hypothetical protein [Maribacter confluentis]
MKKNQLLILSLLFWLPLISFSQTGHGFGFDNYNGIYGVTTNPANSVQSKYRWHINGISYHQIGIADYGAIDYFDLETNPNAFNGLNFSENIDQSSNTNFMVADSDIMLPSVLYNISNNHSVSLILRSRAFSDYTGFNGQLFSALNSNFDNTEEASFNSTINNTTNHWKEVGLNYALVLVNSNYHFVKIGGTAKYLMGSKAVEARGTISGSYTPGASGNVTITDLDLTYLSTTETNLPNEPKKFYSTAFGNFDNNGTGYGGDIGLVYEWRPRETNRVDVRSNAGAVNTYKLKISAAILDIGQITYEHMANIEPKRGVGLNQLINTNGSTVSVEKNEIIDNGLINALKNNPNVSPNPQQGKVTFVLPQTLNIGLDYIIFNDKSYYLNINYIKSLTKNNDLYTNSRLDLITLTPRYETQKFSLYLPITYEQGSSDVYAGFGLRYGPLTIGSAALSSIVMDGKMKHVYVGLNLPLFQDIFR